MPRADMSTPRSRARPSDAGYYPCVRVLEFTYDHLNELLGRLDIPGPVRIDIYKLRGVIERQLLAEGVML